MLPPTQTRLRSESRTDKFFPYFISYFEASDPNCLFALKSFTLEIDSQKHLFIAKVATKTINATDQVCRLMTWDINLFSEILTSRLIMPL